MMLGKIKRIFTSYLNDTCNLSFVDRNLFRGILKRKLKDFDKDHKKNFHSKTLFERLTQI